jgi:hypothetical protein
MTFSVFPTADGHSHTLCLGVGLALCYNRQSIAVVQSDGAAPVSIVWRAL